MMVLYSTLHISMYTCTIKYCKMMYLISQASFLANLGLFGD
jgi:hypothetical protein